MLHRQCFIRPDSLTNPQLDGYGMSGLFGKLVKALAKPFTKIFKPHTLLGKIADPLGLASRNLKWTYKAADIVGTAATLAVGAWAVGAAAGAGAGGFWATAGAGAKIAGGAALKAATAVGSKVGAAAKFLAPAAASMFAGGGGQAQAAESGGIPAQMMAGQGGEWTPGAAGDYSGGYSGGGGGAPSVTVTGGGVIDTPPAEGVSPDIVGTMPEEGPPWLLIGAAAIGVFLLLKSKKRS